MAGDGTAVVVNGLLATQNGVESLAFGIGCNFSGDLRGILWLNVDAHGLVGTDGQRLAQNGVAVSTTHSGDDHFSSLGFYDFKRPDKRVPFVIRIDDELDPFFIETGIPICKRNARCGVRGFTDAD